MRRRKPSLRRGNAATCEQPARSRRHGECKERRVSRRDWGWACDRQRAREEWAALSQVFSKAQTHKRAHGKLCSALLTVRRQTLAARPAVCFFDAFVQCVHRLLVVKAREPAVELCVEVRVLCRL